MSTWRNNGGWNKSHGQVENTPRIDSFELATTQGWSFVMCGKKMIESYYATGDETCDLLPGDGLLPVEIELSSKANGYGGQQLFFLCPDCGGRVRYLYQVGATFHCRKCARLNYKSQQETRSDCMYYYHKGMKLVEDRLPVWTPFRPDGFSFCRYQPDRPRYMHQTTYRRYLARFLRYQEKHAARQMDDMLRILRWFK